MQVVLSLAPSGARPFPAWTRLVSRVHPGGSIVATGNPRADLRQFADRVRALPPLERGRTSPLVRGLGQARAALRLEGDWRGDTWSSPVGPIPLREILGLLGGRGRRGIRVVLRGAGTAAAARAWEAQLDVDAVVPLEGALDHLGGPGGSSTSTGAGGDTQLGPDHNVVWRPTPGEAGNVVEVDLGTDGDIQPPTDGAWACPIVGTVTTETVDGVDKVRLHPADLLGMVVICAGSDGRTVEDWWWLDRKGWPDTFAVVLPYAGARAHLYGSRLMTWQDVLRGMRPTRSTWSGWDTGTETTSGDAWVLKGFFNPDSDVTVGRLKRVAGAAALEGGWYATETTAESAQAYAWWSFTFETTPEDDLYPEATP